MAKSILVIEDNQDVRENIVEILELDGYQVYASANGKLGVQSAIKHIPQLIICDIMMPELDGYGVLKILSRNSKTAGIPFIFLTARAEKTDFRQGMRLGADDYLTKPFDDTELLEAIEMRLRKNQNLGPEEQPSTGHRTFSNEDLAAQAVDQICEGKEVRTFEAKQMVYEKSDTARYVYRVRTGMVKCYQTNEHGKELITHMIHQDQFFGFSSVGTQQIYQESAAAVESTEVVLIPAEEFQQLIFNNRDFATEFIKTIVIENAQLESKMLTVAYGSVRKKVANALLALALFNNTKLNCTISVSRDDLAKFSGIAKETLIRTLSDFNSEGIIQIQSKHIELINMEDLKNMPL